MGKLSFVTAFLLFNLFTALPSSAQLGRTLYVNNNDATCNGQSPCFSTIQAAIDSARAKDTIRIQPGIYREQLFIEKNTSASSTESDRITIEADPSFPPEAVVIQGAEKPQCPDTFAIRIRRSNFITLRGLTITGAGADAIFMMGGTNQSRGIHIDRNRIFGNGGSRCDGGITIARGNPDTLIVNNLIYGNTNNGILFVDGTGGPHYVINNTIHSNTWNGVRVSAGHEVFLVNNIITHNGSATGSGGGRFGVSREASKNPQPEGLQLRNNAICGNRLGEIDGPALDATDSGNLTPSGTEGEGVSASPDCELPEVVYTNLNGPDGLPNTADDDFRLGPNSPAIDRGMDSRTLGLNVLFNSILEADYLRQAARPSDGNADRSLVYDIGALEFPNEPPVADAGADQTVFRGALVSLDGSMSRDPEGATLTFQWTIVSQPSGSSITLNNPTSATPQFTPLILGNYVFQLTVNDGESTSVPDTVAVTAANRAPTANPGGPYAGRVGTPIRFVGSGIDPDGDAVSFSWDFGDGSIAFGASPDHTYTTEGTFTVTLTVTDTFGASASSQTTANVVSALVLNPIGDKTANLGETLTFTVVASNPTGVPISLFVAPLPLPVNASFNAVTGVFTFRPDPAQVGKFQFTFTAASGDQSLSETITVTVALPPTDGVTAVRGRIYNLNNSPLSNVKVTLRATGHTAFSGTNGYFTISGIPPGRQELIVNGRDAHLGVFAILAVSVDLIEGVLNHLPSPITLPEVDVETEVQVSPNFTTVVSNPNLPGVELTISGGAARNPDGTPFTGKLSINPVPDYGRPESRPEELRPGMAVTIQPAGVRFDPPARLTFPNADVMNPGSELNLWSLSPDTGTFNLVGQGVVTSDGQQIVTIQGGVTASAWHFFLASSPIPANAAAEDRFCSSPRCSGVGSEANLEEGSLYLTHSLPSYRSLGQSRGIALTYSSVTADPKPIIVLDATLSARAAVPNSFSTRLELGGVQQGGEVFTHTRALPEDSDSTSRISVQFDASNLPTGRYPYQATVFSNYQNSSIGGITSGSVIVLNRKGSAFGSGWALTGLQQLHLHDGGVLLITGEGKALFFSGGPDSFTSPQGEFSSLVRNADGSFTRTLKDGTKFGLNPQGLQTSLIDRNGNTTGYSYDGNGRLVTITDPVGLVTTLAYTMGKLQKITDPAGRETNFQHDSAGNLIRITNPDGSFTGYQYDGSHRAIQATDERGNTTLYAYDFAGRFSQSTRPTGETRALTPSKRRGLADIASGQGTPVNPVPVVRAENASASLTDGQGNVTGIALNALGQTIAQIDAMGNTTAIQRDGDGNPTRVARPNGAVTTMSYDSRGNLLSSTDPIGATTSFTHEPNFNQVTSIRDPKGNTTTVNYDLRGNPIEIIDALGHRTQMTYDGRGLLTSVTSAVGTPAQNTTSFNYEAKGNLLSTTDPLANVTTLAYDSAGNVIRSTDAEGRATEFAYDAMNRLIAVRDPALQLTIYDYDARGNLIRVTDAKNQITTFTYDEVDRLISATNPLGFAETFTYDANGNLISSTNRNGQTISFNYDALNRLIRKTRPPNSLEIGPQVTNFSYDAVGNLMSVINPTVGVFNQYDLVNRVISSTSATEEVLSGAVVPINSDIVIDANNREFDGRTLQVNGRTLTVNGAHTFANLILVNGAVLTHSPTTGTSLGELDITVTGTLQIDATSRIDVTGRGFLGGGQPGNPSSTNGMTLGFQATNPSGTAGSYGGLGGSFAGSTNPVYGDFRNPNEVGSGGGGFQGAPAGNGGGLARIVAQTIVLDGSIRANGGPATSFSAGGSGGGVRIDAGTISGSGLISANGSPASQSAGGGGGGGGRVAVYYQNATSFIFGNISAFGATFTGSSINGGAGTVYLQGPGRENGELIIDNNNLTVPVTSTTPVLVASNATLFLSHLRVRRTARVKLDGWFNLAGTLEVATASEFVAGNPIIANTINLSNDSVLTHTATTATDTFKLDINVQSLTIDTTSRIDLIGRGFLGGGQPGNPSSTLGMSVGFQPVNGSGTAGSYGGLGGNFAGSTNPVYGDFRNPNEVGSGGGGFQGAPAGNGGGLARIVAQSIVLDGSIWANGGPAASFSAGGSGGGVRIDVGTISGSGSITANGSPASQSAGGGGGGGGRIAVYYQNATSFNFANITAFGAIFSGSSINGGAGTVYLQGPTRESGELIVDNNNLIAPNDTTPLFTAPASSLNLTTLTIRRGANAKSDVLLNVVNRIEISTDARLLIFDRVFASTIQVTTRSVFESGEINAVASFQISDNSLVAHPPATGSILRKLLLNAETLTIDSTSRIDVTGRGFLGGGQPGNPSPTNGITVNFQLGSGSGSGGSYGGLGGGASSNPVYGDFTNPNDLGSGGGAFSGGNRGGNGGGLVRVAVQTLVHDGVIRANGGPTAGGAGGSGGGIRIDVATLSGTGTISANGSDAGSFGGGGGGGGRIAVYYQNATTFDLTTQATAAGGAGSGSPNGQNGTVQFEQQIAMLGPVFIRPPVMTAENNETAVKAVSAAPRSPSQSDLRAIPARHTLLANALTGAVPAGRPQGQIFSAQSVIQTRPVLNSAEVSEIHQNRYLGMLAEGRIENPIWDDFDPIYTYDLNGNRLSMIDPTGLTTYTYDALNRLTSITNNRGLTTTFTYDALGRRTSMAHANGVVTSYEYDAASQLTRLAHQFGAATINSFDYNYDRVGNRTTKTTRDGAHNYTYDTLNRLIQATNPLPANPLESFTYDAVGNRVNSNQNGLSSFNEANQLLEDASFTYQYDNNGNLVRKMNKATSAFTLYEYNAENKLVRAVSNGTTVNYRYDGVGRRVEKEINDGATTQVTRFIYDNEDILLELDGSNQITARYTHGPGIDEPLMVETGGANFFYHPDGLGSITEITDSAGTVRQRYTYSSFGKIESQLDANFIQPYTFTGREFDPETGLYYYRARYYDPIRGSFLSEDPTRSLTTAGLGDIVLGLTMTVRRLQNGYQPFVYAANDPVNLIDPDGQIGVIAAVVGTAVIVTGIYAAVDTLLRYARPQFQEREQAIMDAADGKPGAEQRAQRAQQEIARAAKLAAQFCDLGLTTLHDPHVIVGAIVNP